jgi:DNA replication and repair protein RecF
MPSAVTGLTLLRFRSHARTTLAFDGRPVAVVGPNGAGKTNILEALSLLSPGRGLRAAAAADLAQAGGPGWRVAAEAAGHEVETWAEADGPRQVRIDGKAAPQAGLGRVVRVLWLVPAMDRLWTEGAEGRRRFLDRMTLGFAPDHAELSLTYDKAMRDRNRLLKDGVGDPHWYGALEAQMAAAALGIRANRAATLARLALAQEEAGPFPCADLTLTDPEAAPPDLAAHWARTRARDMAAGRTLAGPHRADLAAVWRARGMPAAQCSTGEQKALLISLLLACARALSDDLGAAPVLLLDEVAAHLDEGRRAALYDAICDLGAQAFMTGTEAALFDALGPRGARLTVAEAGGVSRVG